MREERRGGGALLFTSYKRNCVFEFSSGIFRQIFEDRSNEETIEDDHPCTDESVDGWMDGERLLRHWTAFGLCRCIGRSGERETTTWSNRGGERKREIRRT